MRFLIEAHLRKYLTVPIINSNLKFAYYKEALLSFLSAMMTYCKCGTFFKKGSANSL